MKKILGLVLSLVLAFGALAGSIKPPTGFAGQLWNGTFALYGTRGDTTHFLCTAEAVRKIDIGYVLLSAGHCVSGNPPDVQYAVAEEVGGTLMPVTVVKSVRKDNIDFSVFSFPSTKKYTVMELDRDGDVQVGDKTINPNFALGLGKQISLGTVSSLGLVPSEECDMPACLGDFMVQEYAGPGASGSPVLSLKTHKVIGIVVLEWQGANIGFSVEPIGRLAEFDKVQADPKPAVGASEDTSLRIPEADFQSTFGENHPFTLTVHGPDPRFTLAGWTFVVITDGFELSDDYYYNVPVYIDEAESGEYRLTSTRDGVSVGVIVVKGPTE